MIACVTFEVSGLTPIWTSVFGAAPTRFKVRPATVFATVLPALLMGTPSTVNEASVPVAPLVKLRPLLTLLIVRSLAAPDVLLTIARRAPLESFTTLAVTPRFALVIAAASPSRVLLVASMVMVAAGWLPT